MSFIETFIFYFVIALGIILFLKLDSRISFIYRILITVAAVFVLLLLFLFISALITIVIIVVLVLVLISFLEGKRLKLKRYFRK